MTKEIAVAKRIERLADAEFDFMFKQGYITRDGEVTKAGALSIFAGNLPAGGIQYVRDPDAGKDEPPQSEGGQP